MSKTPYETEAKQILNEEANGEQMVILNEVPEIFSDLDIQDKEKKED